jgi:hypothetical protein
MMAEVQSKYNTKMFSLYLTENTVLYMTDTNQSVKAIKQHVVLVKGKEKNKGEHQLKLNLMVLTMVNNTQN